MTAIVEDLLLLARSDSGAVALEHIPVDLGDVAADGASAMGKPATDRGVRVEVDPQPAVVAGDPARLRQLVMILVDNAIRHSPADGRVGVAVRAERAAARRSSSRTTARASGPRTCRTSSSASTGRRGAPGGGTGLGPRDRRVDRGSPRRPDRGRQPSRGRGPLRRRPAGRPAGSLRLTARPQPRGPGSDPSLGPDGAAVVGDRIGGVVVAAAVAGEPGQARRCPSRTRRSHRHR